MLVVHLQSLTGGPMMLHAGTQNPSRSAKARSHSTAAPVARSRAALPLNRARLGSRMDLHGRTRGNGRTFFFTETLGWSTRARRRVRAWLQVLADCRRTGSGKSCLIVVYLHRTVPTDKDKEQLGEVTTQRRCCK
jgi:hypothetical protein